MMNTLERLVYMANQIARNFQTMGHDMAAKATADHLAQFWEPRMKSMIFDHLHGGGEGLEPPALAAVRMLAEDGPPGSQTRATEFNHVDEVGHADAG